MLCWGRRLYQLWPSVSTDSLEWNICAHTTWTTAMKIKWGEFETCGAVSTFHCFISRVSRNKIYAIYVLGQSQLRGYIPPQFIHPWPQHSLSIGAATTAIGLQIGALHSLITQTKLGLHPIQGQGSCQPYSTRESHRVFHSLVTTVDRDILHRSPPEKHLPLK